MSTKELKVGGFVGSLDVGTSSIRFMIFDKHANIIAQHQSEYEQYHPQPGWIEQDPEEMITVSNTCIVEACNALKEKGWATESVKAVGLTNQRETTVAWSRSSGKPLHKAIVWGDSRNKTLVSKHEERLSADGFNGQTGQAAISALRERTGLTLSPYFSALKLVWMIENSADVKSAHDSDDLLFGTVDTWVLYNLLGDKVHITEPTNASRTLLMDIKTLKWDENLLSFFGLRSSILPTIKSSSEDYGKIQSGPLKGVSICGLAGDQCASLIGNKCLVEGSAKSTYGTGAFLLFCTGSTPVISHNGLLTTIACQPGPNQDPIYALEGAISVAGVAIKWLRDSLRLIKDAADVNELIAKSKNNGGVYFVTAFSGLLAPYWDPSAGGLLIGLTAGSKPEHIARATVEAVAFQTRAVIDAMKKDAEVDLHQLAVDGGMSNGDECMQLLADIGGFTVRRPKMREGTSLGAALLAGAAAKLHGWDLAKPDSFAQVNTAGVTEFKPSLSEARRDKKWKKWNDAISRSKRWHEHPDESDDE